MRQHIARLREERGVSQRQVAQAIDVTPQTISIIETSNSPMSTKTAELLADYFGVSTDYILGRTKERRGA